MNTHPPSVSIHLCDHLNKHPFLAYTLRKVNKLLRSQYGIYSCLQADLHCCRKYCKKTVGSPHYLNQFFKNYQPEPLLLIRRSTTEKISTPCVFLLNVGLTSITVLIFALQLHRNDWHDHKICLFIKFASQKLSSTPTRSYKIRFTLAPHVDRWFPLSSSGVFELRPTGHIRFTKPFHPGAKRFYQQWYIEYLRNNCRFGRM